ncbi:uncharacterized protein LOC105205454 [Solenopsis invicta]|uniref:uncharacterized protein LOC105205454 n=1 Tax=Solenopsis invicta TaxID=13686 RepID=UPI00193D832F|nr:uncharacterized protein LOC105205454 [Solenopsis invicta]XP_039304650.1 uncharacterized protein LOC105205454 [Solenopsis invicta]XP_039304660.1 uncharacterized protein LOC105205454 [Solenopsis invicta]XP_039304667.1 uncharacterized protein LOC105205454 [Solenopsis invicta]
MFRHLNLILKASLRLEIDQELCKKSTKETNTSIIAAYISASKQRSLHSSADHENEASNVSNNKEDKCSSNDLLKEKQKELDECLLKLKHAENRAKHWEEQYNTLKESGNYNLTEKTGKDIVTILETISNRTIHDDIGDNAPQYENKINAFKERTTHIGNDVWIPTMIYEELMREKEFTSFIKSACYAVWGPGKLAERSVREQRNVKEPTLTPTKKSAVSSLFCHWMRDKRHMPQTFIEEQMNRTKLNKYFNGAISAARKKINYKTIKTPNPEVTQKKNPTTEHLQNLEVSGDDKSDSEHSCSQSSEASCD